MPGSTAILFILRYRAERSGSGQVEHLVSPDGGNAFAHGELRWSRSTGRRGRARAPPPRGYPRRAVPDVRRYVGGRATRPVPRYADGDVVHVLYQEGRLRAGRGTTAARSRASTTPTPVPRLRSD